MAATSGKETNKGEVNCDDPLNLQPFAPWLGVFIPLRILFGSARPVRSRVEGSTDGDVIGDLYVVVAARQKAMILLH